MKNKLHIVLPIMSCFLGCGALKKDNLNVKLKEATNLEFVSESASFTQKNILVKDSLNTAFEMEIWPKGKFLFSAQGFEGEATKLLVKGRVESLKQLTHQDVVQLQDNTTQKSSVLNKQHYSTLREKRSTNFLPRLVFLSLLLLTVIAWLWLKRKKNVFS